MNWSTIRPALLGLAVSTTGIADTDAVKWRGNAPAGQWRKGPRITMACRSTRAVGTDEERRQDNEVDWAGNQVVRISGQRRITWSLNFEAESADDAEIAYAYADRFRAALRFQSSRDALNAAGLSIGTIEATQYVEFNNQSRSFSSAVVDVQLNAVENYTDDTDGAGNWIASTEWLSDTLDGEDGEPTTTQIDDGVSAEG